MFSRRISFDHLRVPNYQRMRGPTVILTTVKVEGVKWARGSREKGHIGT
jgi:hypothetical protein